MKKFYLHPRLSSATKKTKRFACLAAVSFLIGFLPVKLFAQAPVISYGTPQNYLLNTAITPLNPSNSGGAVAAPTGACGGPVLLGSGLTFSVNGAAVDAAGNIYVNDIVGGNGTVKKIAADGSSTTIIGSGFLSQSANVAVDLSGNVYVADQASVWKIPASGNPATYGTPVVINNTFTRPFGIAVDAAGNVYVADLNTGVYKMASDGTNKVKIDNGISSPSAVTVDAAGNVYAVSIGDLKLYEIPANGSPQVVLASGFSFPRGLAVDASGTIYIDDESASTIFTVPQGGGTPFAYVSGLSNAVGVAVDAGYNLIVALQGTGGMTRYSPTGGYFISPLLPSGLSLNTTTGVISGTPTASSPARGYVISGYNSTGGSSATINIAVGSVFFSYSSPQTYTAGTAITALNPSVSAGSVAAPGYKAPPVSIGSGFSNPFGVAIDASGNVYVADAGNSAVKKIPVGGGAPVSIGSGFDYPTGVAVDAAGDVFVADPGNSSVFEIPAGGGAQVTLGNGFVGPNAVAVDASGNVYVTDENTGTLYKIPAGNATPVILGAGFSDLTAVSVDQSGNLYVIDGGNSAVYTVPVGGGIPVSLGGSFLYPTGVAADASGNVYVTDGDANHVFKLSACGCTQVSVAGFLNSPNGLAVDGAGNIYVGDTNDNRVKKITPKGGYFINTPLPAGLSLNDTTGTISGKPKRVSSSTNYTITAYNAAGAGSATLNIAVIAPPPPVISYATPQTYTAGTAISPLIPSSSGGLVATPAYSNSQVSIGSGFNNPFGTAIDALGNIYIADAGNSAVKKIPAGGGAPESIGSGFDYPTGVAVDAAGNVFVADQGNSSVFEIPAGGGPQVTLGSGFSAPNGVAVDGMGNVYVTDEGNDAVYEIPAGNGTPVELASLFIYPTAIAIDGSGNLFIADGGAGAVYRLPKTGGIPELIGQQFIFPTGVAVDALGNVYVVDGDAGTVFKVPGGGYGQIAIANGFNEPGGVAIDGSGNVYVGDTNNNAIVEINPAGGYFINASLPSGLSLDSKTGVISGTPTTGSTATDYTVTAYNAGGSSTSTVNVTVNIPPPPVVSYITPQVYNPGITISPLTPTANGVDAPAYSTTFTTVGTGFIFPASTAVDKKGNIYVADVANNTIDLIPVGGGPQSTIGTGFNGPTGVAVDTAGNVFVADAGNSAIVEIPAGGGPQINISSGFNYPAAVAVDNDGNVYIADAGRGKIYKYSTKKGFRSLFASGFSYPSGLAVDAAGNVYVADPGSGASPAVFKIPATGGAGVKLNHCFNFPGGVATDASGNVYVSDAANRNIVEFPSGGAPKVIIGGLDLPYGVAVDGAGNLYVPDIGTSRVDVVKPIGGFYISPVLPSGLSFNSSTGTISGTPVAGSPATDYTVKAYNPGGRALAIVNIKVLSNNAALLQLTPSKGTLAPVFASTKTSYTISVFNPVNSITLTPVAQDTGATIKINGTIVKSGLASAVLPLSVGSNTITTVVTAADGVGSQTYTISLNRLPSTNAKLLKLTTSHGGFSPSFNNTVTAYTQTVNNAVTSIAFTPTTVDTTATITVNGDPVVSGSSSTAQALTVGDNIENIVVTAQDGTTTMAYTITVTRALPANAKLINLKSSHGGFTPSFNNTVTSFSMTVANAVSSIIFTPTAADPAANITVNGSTTASGSPSTAQLLDVGDNLVNVIVTAQDGTTTITYTITITRAKSGNANLFTLKSNRGGLTATSPPSTSYTKNVGNAITSISFTPTTVDPNATVTVGGSITPSGTASVDQPLTVGDNIIDIVVTAQDGSTTKTYAITVIRAAASLNTVYQPVSVTNPANSLQLGEDGIMVHQGLSPNGDGMNDFLLIEGINKHPDNKLQIMNRSGQLVFETKGYDNSTKVFDGHSNKNGQMQLPGTYFYSLDYTDQGVTMHKTGFIVLKY